MSGSGLLGALILGGAKGKDRVEYKGQENQAYSGSGASTEGFGDFISGNNRYDYIHKWNQEENDPPYWFANNFQKHDDVIDGNDGRPAGVSSLGEIYNYFQVITEMDVFYPPTKYNKFFYLSGELKLTFTR